MLRDEVEQYTKLTGEDGWHAPIIKVGAYLDGYNKGLVALDKIRTEIEELRFGQPLRKRVVDECLKIIDKYKAEE